MSNLRILNLSCNKISKIQGLQNTLRTLEKIVISHNRISSIEYFAEAVQFGQQAPYLTHIDLNDNYIGDLQQI